MSTKLTWYGHACFLIDTGDTKVLTDPFLTGNPLAPVAAEEVNTDFILVSHGHGDHLGDTLEIAKRTGATEAHSASPGGESNLPLPTTGRLFPMDRMVAIRPVF